MSRREQHQAMRTRVLNQATLLFLKNGYHATTIRGIANAAEVSPGAVQGLFASKEDVLCALVDYVFDSQYAVAERLVKGVTDDMVLFYAVKMVLQLYMAESSEAVRDIYVAAYSMPKSSRMIQRADTAKVEMIFGKYFPEMKTQDFFRMEIASGSIMWGFMAEPCDMWFTMDMKVESFLETTFRVYMMTEEKIREAVEFVSQFDFKRIAQETIDYVLKFAEVGEQKKAAMQA